MADVTKRVAKRAASLFETGETVLVALLGEPRGTYSGGGLAAVAAVGRPASWAIRKAAERSADDAGVAASFPVAAMFLVVTDRRLAALPSNGLTAREIATSVERGWVSDVVVESRGLGRRLTVTFADGSALEVDCQRGQPFDRFRELLVG